MVLSLRRIAALMVKEFLAIMRDPKSRVVAVVPPLIQFLVFGYAATFEVKEVRIAVLDQSKTAESRQFIADIMASGTFRLVREIESPAQIAAIIDRDEARMVIHLGQDFARDLARGETAAVQVIADGRNSNVAAVANGYLAEIAGRFGVARGRAGALRIVDRAWFNENLSSRWYIVAPLPATIVMTVVMLLSSLTIAREREFGSFDQLLVAPFSATEILIGKALPVVMLGMFTAGLLSLAGVFWFELPFRGSVVALLTTIFLFSLSVVGVGLFVSSLATTMQQGLLGSFVFIMPAVILSGFTTPIGNMPSWLQTGTLVNPLRYAVANLRSIYLEGAGLNDVAPTFIPLLAIAGVTLSAAAWMFRRRSV